MRGARDTSYQNKPINVILALYLRPARALVASLLLALAAAFPTTTSARTIFSLKTNLLYDAALNVNVGAELRLAPRWSLDANGNMNFWKLSGGTQWRHWFVQPELRYWFCEANAGHFVGLHLHGGQYNLAKLGKGFRMLGTDFRNLKDMRYQGWFAGAGLAYGYAWVFNTHWGMEAEIGFGWAYSRYDVFPCAGCGRKVEDDRVHNYVGPTKGALNLVYTF